jgi:hypothetical protein
VIVIAEVIMLAVLLFGGRRAKEKRPVQSRAQAQELRQEAGARTRRVEQREALAEEQAAQAHEERKQAAKVAEPAARVHPDRDD